MKYNFYSKQYMISNSSSEYFEDKNHYDDDSVNGNSFGNVSVANTSTDGKPTGYAQTSNFYDDGFSDNHFYNDNVVADSS